MLVVLNSVSKNSCQAASKSDMKLQNSSAPVKWDSGNKPEIDNTYYVYNCGNDGLYHLALAEESKWELPAVEEREVSEKERSTLEILRQQRGTNVPADHRCTGPAYDEGKTHDLGVPQSCKTLGPKHTSTK